MESLNEELWQVCSTDPQVTLCLAHRKERVAQLTGRVHLHSFESGADSQRWKDWMRKGGDSIVKRAAEKQPAGHTRLKTSGVTV